MKNNKLGFTISVFFLFGMILKESVILPLVSFVVPNDFYAIKISYVLFALIVSYLLFNYVILPNKQIKAVINLQGVSVHNIAIAVIIGFITIALAFALWGVQAFVTAQFSEELVNSLWAFELREIEFSRNSKLGASAYTFVTFLLVHTFISPLVEELLFRGVLLKVWSDKYGPLKALLLTSLLFTLMHSTRFYLDNFIFSILLGWVVLHTGKVLYAYIIHATYNLFSWLLEGYNSLLFFENKDPSKLHLFNTWYIEFSLLLLAIVFIPLCILKFKVREASTN